MKKLRRDIILTMTGLLMFWVERWAFKNIDIRLSTEMAIYGVTYLIIAFGVAEKAVERMRNQKILNEYLLILTATACSFLIYQYVEGITVLLFFQAGSLLEGIMMHKCEKSIAKLMDISPGTANRKEGEREVPVEPKDLECGDVLIIKPGEKVPVDSLVLSGTSTIDVKALTGESLPQTAVRGTMIYSGSINLTGVLEAEVVKEYRNSTASRILAMVRRANDNKTDSESSVTRFTSVYTPMVMLLTVLLAVIPPLTFEDGDWYTWIYRAITFLIVACPWGMVISIPLTFYGGIGAAARQGIMIKSNRYLELLTKADTFVFDKTGTLTKGVFEVREIVPVGMTEEELLDVTAHIESFSNHPISLSLMQIYDREINKSRVEQVKELPGYGIRAVIDGRRAYVGSRKLMWERRIAVPKVHGEGTVVYVALDGAYAGYILIGDILRDEVRETMDILKRRYHKVLVLLTGDNEIVGKAVGKTLKMDYVYTDLLPAEKVERIEEFLESEREGEKLVYVGDGINDAPVLKRADIGIAMGSLGADAAVEAADIVLMEDETDLIVTLLRIARETVGAIHQNLVLSVGIKLLLLCLAAAGLITMWTAIVADVMIVTVTLFNAMWLLRYPS